MLEGVEISILIPVHDIDHKQAQITQIVIESAAEASQHFASEVIVIDDRSPCKDALKRMPNASNNIKIVQIKNHPGLVSALNYGATVAQGSLLTYCHSDCLIQAGTIEKILGLFLDLEIGLGTSELYYQNGDLQQVGGWIGPGFRLSWDTSLSSLARPIHWGDFWTVRTRLFQEVGCLQSCYNPGYWECVDLAVSVRMNGYQVMTCPKSKVTHLKSQTFHRLHSGKERLALFERNREIFASRWSRFESEIINGVPDGIHEEEWK